MGWPLIIIAYVLVIALSIRNKKPVPPDPRASLSSTAQNQLPPKIIYTFWDSQELPLIVKASIETWKRHCPDYEIRIMNYENTKDIPIRHRDSHARYADFVRLWCLTETGGVWIDASVFLQRPLDEILTEPGDYTGYKFYINTTHTEWPVIENWFMAAPKGSRFVTDWKNEFFRANEFDCMGDYVDDLLKRGLDRQNVRREWYFASYLACQYCQQNFGPYENLNLIEASDDALKYIMDVPYVLRWIPGMCGKNLMRNFDEYRSCRMIKIVSNDRPSITDEFILENIIG